MTLPTISPTGTMASGIYVDYMMGYCENAIDSLADQAKTYPANLTMSSWDTMWDSVLKETESKITTLESNINTLKSQIIMARNAVSGIMYG